MNATGVVYVASLNPADPEVPDSGVVEVFVRFDESLTVSELPSSLYMREYFGECVQAEPDPNSVYFLERLNDPAVTGFKNGLYDNLQIDIGLGG